VGLFLSTGAISMIPLNVTQTKNCQSKSKLVQDKSL